MNPLPSPLEAIPDMRATAKWTVASLGAVGAALITVVPLTVFDDLHGTGDLVTAAIGLALAIAGVCWAIWHTAEALTPPVTVIEDLDGKDLAPIRALLARSPESFFGPFGTSVADLARHRRFHETVEANLTEALAETADPTETQALERALANAATNIALARTLHHRLLEFTHTWQVRTTLKKARTQTMLGVATTLAGLILTATTAVQ
ncbi:hypothetical protein AB0B28_10765 [Glycomyces sp. NPDC046736]|uniref:hypothetical protein n=1 Tax=Glycomyces sp. NPDC046736 TaxID=3155615 RepID=UPI0033E12BA5